MVKAKDLAIELSIKLGDPRTDNGDGQLFFKTDRIKYIDRAYTKLVRTLKMAMREYRPSFVLPLEPAIVAEDKVVNKKSPYAFNASILDVEEVIVTRKKGQTSERKIASKLDARNYNLAKYDLDPNNKAGDDNILYSFINGVLYLLPDDAKYLAIDAMIVQDLLEVKEDTILPVDRTYTDMLVNMAAIEATRDLPHPQKVQLYRSELVDDVSVISAYANLMERGEGERK